MVDLTHSVATGIARWLNTGENLTVTGTGPLTFHVLRERPISFCCDVIFNTDWGHWFTDTIACPPLTKNKETRHGPKTKPTVLRMVRWTREDERARRV